MKALSLWQPWASLMAIGAKTIETRSWPTSYRGDLLICATKRFPQEAKELCCTPPFNRVMHDAGFIKVGDLEAWCGYATCLVEVYGCVQFGEKMPVTQYPLPPYEQEFGDFTRGRYGILTRNLRPLTHGITVSGMQGIFNVSDDVASAVAESISELGRGP